MDEFLKQYKKDIKRLASELMYDIEQFASNEDYELEDVLRDVKQHLNMDNRRNQYERYIILPHSKRTQDDENSLFYK